MLHVIFVLIRSIRFFSSYSNYVPIENVLSYTQHRSELISKWEGHDFDDAVNLCDEFIRDPKVYICEYS